MDLDANHQRCPPVLRVSYFRQFNSMSAHLIYSFVVDGEDVTLKYSDFTAYTGPGFTYADGRKNCQLTLSIQYVDNHEHQIAIHSDVVSFPRVPPGYQFAFDKFSHVSLRQEPRASLMLNSTL